MTPQELSDAIKQMQQDVVFIKTEIIALKNEFANMKMYMADRMVTAPGGRRVAMQAPPEPAKIQLAGTVVNDKLAPLSGVNIRIYDGTTSEVVATATSDNIGEWNAFVMKAGPYSIEYVRPGVINKNVNVVIPPGKLQYRLGKGR